MQTENNPIIKFEIDEAGISNFGEIEGFSSQTITLNSDVLCERMTVNSTTAQQNPPSHYIGEKNAIHGSSNFVSLTDQTIESKFNSPIIFQLSAAGATQEPYPKHDKIHILMYVGKPKMM